MTPSERRVTGALSAIYILRMLGLFLLLPVLALYVEHLPGSTPLLVGLAVGTYGLTQALFGIPFGNASDRFGRKPVITVGLLLFAIGSGPVRGFAVTLAIGIITSMFTAIVGTRAVINLMFGGKRIKKLSI
jgi:MFS family permease